MRRLRTTIAVATAAALATLAGTSLAPAQAADDGSVSVTPALGDVVNAFAVGTLLSGTLGSPSANFEALTNSDPFYDETGVDRYAEHGTLLKSKAVDVMFLGFQPGNIRAWKVMYPTTGEHGEKVISTGILMVPDDGRPDWTRPLIGYQMANDSLGPNCHPSGTLTGSKPMDAAAWSALGPLAMFFDRGAAVMVSDVGNNGSQETHGVFAGKFAGAAMLDGLRAALNLSKQERGLRLARSPKIGLFAVAGGAVGAGFAGELAAKYTPELRIKATVLEGMVVDMKTFFKYADGTMGSGFAFATLLGLAEWYPEWQIDRDLNLIGRALAKVYRNVCQSPTYFALPFVPLKSLFKDRVSPADRPKYQQAFTDSLLGQAATGTPQGKVLVASCEEDNSPLQLIPAEDSRTLVRWYQEQGVDVTYEPTDCSMVRLLTNPYGWATDLFGMQTIPWLFDTIEAS
ncbi:lipase [Nocardioides sp. GY 10113]|uniref:lipase family protein n=1 Tax=Nocardioides sp. GY 10113 TaxID=2569761 RepID=UPI0010A83E46|nr:lipase family protein [Nocardioides sp. GY 10113]TIC88586.1 lipase [Nocardioides sp. GY 10113]